MTIDELRNALDEAIEEMSDEQVIELHNSVADDYSSYDKIYSMEDFDEIIDGYFEFSPMDLVKSISAYFDTADEYFVVKDTGDICSFTDLYDVDSPWDKQACIDCIIDYEESYGNPDIQLILDRYNEEYDEPEMI